MLRIYGNEVLQEYLFKKCIIENPDYFGNPTEHNITIDHVGGKSYLNGKEYPILFPQSLYDYVDTLPKEKTIDYYFKGVITEKRKWIREYSNKGVIINSLGGRDPHTKYNIDTHYYSNMSESKFTFTPTGDCPWSYRLFESIMCFSIPIMEDNTNDVYHHHFKTFSRSEEHIYDPEITQHNYSVLKEMFTPHFK